MRSAKQETYGAEYRKRGQRQELNFKRGQAGSNKTVPAGQSVPSGKLFSSDLKADLPSTNLVGRARGFPRLRFLHNRRRSRVATSGKGEDAVPDG
jgi:hypothetical protein